MSISVEYLTTFWILSGAFVYGLVIFRAVRTAQWWRLWNQRDLNVLICAALGVWFMWTMKANGMSTLNLHFLGATLLTLMFGWSFAILAISVVIVSITINQGDIWTTVPWNILLTGVLPISISYYLFRVVDRRLPNNYFIYIFICAFIGAALSMAGVIFATTSMHYLTGSFSLEELTYNYLPFGLLLMFPEAFLTGMLMSIFVVYRPEWVCTFDDKRYLKNH